MLISTVTVIPAIAAPDDSSIYDSRPLVRGRSSNLLLSRRFERTVMTS
jgi:hypothetical protein